MAKRTTKVKIKTNKPDHFLKLCEDIVEHNTELGASSPFASGDLVNMTDYAAKVSQARQLRTEAEEHCAIARAAMARSRVILGTNGGQTSTTPGTLINMTGNIRKILLALNTVNPEALSEWGFDVVVRVAKNPGRRKKK